LGYIFIFCFENDGYKFYNCMKLSQTCAKDAQIVNEANTLELFLPQTTRERKGREKERWERRERKGWQKGREGGERGRIKFPLGRNPAYATMNW